MIILDQKRDGDVNLKGNKHDSQGEPKGIFSSRKRPQN